MSVVTSIRDYIEVLNTQIGTREDPVSLVSVIFETFPHILEMCKDTLWYFISFKGLRDNFYQPYLGGEEDSIKKFIENGFFLSGTNGNFTQNSIFNLNFFLNGFGNSFFLSLPGSIGTLIILRRIILQGIPAGIAATVGSVIGTCFIMVSVTFGGRFVSLSPAFLDLFFFLGLLIPGYIILRSSSSNFRIISAGDKFSLVSIGLIHFLLQMSNQSTLFKHLRDLTITPNPTRFLISSNISQIVYILGFSIGSVLFTALAFFVTISVINWLLARFAISRSRLMNLSENTSIVLLTAYSISTLSYYGTDFLLTKGFGFLPADKGFSETVLAPNTLFKDPHNLTGVHALYPSNEFSLDPAPFDRPLDKLFRRSILLKQPSFKYRSFEELNYQGEKHWLHRGFRHGSAKPIKTVTLPTEKNTLSRGKALLRSLDKAYGAPLKEGENNKKTIFSFTNLAKEDILFDFAPPTKGLRDNLEYFDNLQFLEQRFKRLFFGQIGLLPGRLPSTPYGPLDSQEMAHKRLAFTNPVYKALLSFDIDLFLKRQPANQSLSAEDEHNIFLKRQLLERYINTQREYFEKKTQNYFNFNSNKNQSEPWASGGSKDQEGPLASLSLAPIEQENFIKSVANQTYKHQFKGTLEIVRQMFAVSLDCPEPSTIAGGGSWDQLMKGVDFFSDDKGIVIPRPKNPRLLKFDQPLYTKKTNSASSFFRSTTKTKESALPFVHEELYNQAAPYNLRSSFNTEQNPFLEKVFISPLYYGWDNQRRQLLLTQRYLDRKDALISLDSFGYGKKSLTKSTQKPSSKPIDQKEAEIWSENQSSTKRKNLLDKKQSSSFSNFVTTWPIHKPDPANLSPTNWRIPSRSFEHMLALEEEARVGLDEPSDKNKGIRGSYERFVELWNNKVLQESQIPSFKLTRWPINITTPSVQADLDSFEQIEKSLFTGVKRGGFIWPGTESIRKSKGF